jgi:hypothetical protein
MARKDKTMTLNELLTRTDLSWKAKGLAAAITLMAGRFKEAGPDKISILLANGTGGAAAVHSGLRELVDAGILTRTHLRENEHSGSVTGSTWTLDVEWPSKGMRRTRFLRTRRGKWQPAPRLHTR